MAREAEHRQPGLMSTVFTHDVIAAGLDAAAMEMFDVLRRTAMSPIIYEVLDVGTGILDANGALISSGAGIPSFVGALDKSVAAIISRLGTTVSAGDVFITNDPNHGGVTHLNDVVVAEPVFHQGQLLAWVASIAHWGDVGGRTPGSMATDTSELVAEGLRLPMVRLFKQGALNTAVFDIIRCNSRLPDFVEGDLWAQVSAGRRAAEVIRQLCDRYGQSALSSAIDDARSIGERRALRGLQQLPKGWYTIEQEQDDGSVWRLGINISETQFCVDLRDAPVESTGPHNTSRDGTIIACQMLFKALTDPERFANAGSFAPLEVLTTPGTRFHAGPTAAHAYYFETRIQLFDLLWQCLAEALPDRLPAGHFGTIYGTVIAGVHPDSGRRYAMVEPQMGGWGATRHRAGESAMFSTSHGDTFNCPVEIAEARYGFHVIEKRLTPTQPCADEHPGGAGVVTRYQLRAEATLSAGFSHAVTPVWSLDDAQLGGVNRLHIERSTGSAAQPAMTSGMHLQSGDVITVSTANGGSAPRSGD